MKGFYLAVVSAALALTNVSAKAAEENRNGLLLGVAVGSSAINTSTESAEGTGNGAYEQDDKGGAFSLRIGGSVGEKSAVYLLGQGSATEAELGHSLVGLGASYYFRKSGASLYLTGGYGYGTVSYAERDVAEGTGKAAMVGVGLELSWGLNLELNHMRVNTTPETTDNGVSAGVNYDIESTQFLVGLTWF